MGNRFPAISIISVYLISTYLCGFLWYMSQTKATTLQRNISRLTLAIVIGVIFFCFFSSVQFSLSVVSDSLRPHDLQHARPPCPSPTPEAYPNSCPSSRWCHPAISSPVVPFSSCPQSFPASESFPMSQLFTWDGQSIGVSVQHQSFQWTPRTDLLSDGLIGSPCSPRDSQESSPTPQFKSINSSALSFLHSPTLTSIHDHWKNHTLE